ncbi:MAG TPA: serine/threonine-protein kinase [Bryobacteraceae bacterium]|nr:serine/threonine-protein kinase [Bryobacteraceae bacterium]
MAYTHAADWSRIDAVFNEALSLEPSERSSFLDRVCGNEAELRHEIEELLRWSEKTLGILSDSINGAATELIKPSDLAGHRIGPYRLLRLLGEGGMGRVYLAERADEAYKSTVAIKVMNASLGDRKTMLLRFISERQILANLQHPNIARLLDGGLNSDGVSYLVMEYVDGMPIDQYCAREKLSLHERLNLFQKVAEAVEYAHSRFIVHRDLKPANILVSADGEPKLLDFGIAKLLDEVPGSPSALTCGTERLLTPEYASPEQISGEPVSTATDVYGLGILLYELLTGRRPYRFETHSPLAVARVICEKDPDPPSTAAREASSETALELRKLGPDIDNIVLMAMRKDPAQRYSSVGLLSADIKAFLEGYPVIARQPSWGYRSRKFIGRHKLGVSAVMAAALALIGFSFAMGLLARRANLEQRKAQREAEFLTSMFNAASPSEARGHELTARNLLDRGAERVDRELKSEPQVRISLLTTMAEAYKDLGDYDRGLALLKPLFSGSGVLQQASPLEQAAAMEAEGTLYRMKSEYKTAEPLFRRALDVRQKVLPAGDDLVISSLASLGECLYLEQSDSEAEQVLRQALNLSRKLQPDNRSDVRNYLALLVKRKGDFTSAANLLSEAVQIDRRSLGEDSPDYMVTLHNWASALIDKGDLNGAETNLRSLLVIRRKVLGNDHPDIAYTLNNLGYVLLEEGKAAAAGPLLKENLDLRVRQFGSDDPATIGGWNNWARYQEVVGNDGDAEENFRHALAIATKESAESWSVAQIESNLGQLALDRGDAVTAERLARSALEIHQKLGPPDAPIVASSLLEVGYSRLYQGDAQGAESLFRKGLTIRQNKLAPDNPAIAAAELRLGEALIIEKRYDEADRYFAAAFRYVHAPPFPLPHWQIAETDEDYNACRSLMRKPAEPPSGLTDSDLQTDPRPYLRQAAKTRLADLEKRANQYFALKADQSALR